MSGPGGATSMTFFCIWDGTSVDLLNFQAERNDVFPELKFTITYSVDKIQFWDTMVYKHGDVLCTDLFTKKTNRNSLLYYNSYHPSRMVDSLSWSQTVPVRRIVSDEDKCDSRLDEMCNRFIQRGYPKTEVIHHKNRAINLTQEELSINKNRTKQKCVPFVSTYCPASNGIGSSLKKHWGLLGKVLSIPIPQVSGIGRYLRYRNSDTEIRYFCDIGYRYRKCKIKN
ncbi:unnamed protein product [Ranitomeya imitator]|uniref:Uncharacterized protein n=1 Tax=Ranitomeya imitator TaxID=111125 RepID=A0ABN9MA68_9NEOB|nr:unnamed protein product [Ranitomeya imitator]